jgi:hypothetical protein
VVWLGVVRDEQALHDLEAAMVRSEKALAATGLLRGTAERIVMNPTPRSRLRWLDAP